jgi:Ca-activated chloride channel family protein
LVIASFALAGTAAEPALWVGPLATGDAGDAVLALQVRLAQLGYLTQAPTGQYDAATTEAVKAFQAANSLPVDGICDQATWALLFSDAAIALNGDAGGTDTRTTDALEAAAPDKAWEIAYMPIYTGSPMLAAAPAAEFNTNEYSTFVENRFMSVVSDPFSTFAADVDTASYAQLRSLILDGTDVPAASVRIEEMLNYFKYDYHQPAAGEPFGVTMEMTDTPWNKDTRLLLIGLQAKEIPLAERRPQNLVFLLDVSGSMDSPDKLPLVKRACRYGVHRDLRFDGSSLAGRGKRRQQGADYGSDRRAVRGRGNRWGGRHPHSLCAGEEALYKGRCQPRHTGN